VATGDRARAALGMETSESRELSPLDRRIERTRSMELAFRDAVASGLRPETLIRDAITALRNTPDLVKCDETTFFGALMSAAQLGLRPNVPSLGHGWVLPFWSGRRNRHEAQWILGYQGMVELGYKSGLVAKIATDTIYANDVYRIRRGTHDELIHEPVLDPSERGDVVGHYAVVWLQTGQPLWKFMPEADVQALMERFAARNRERQIVGPWRDDYTAMAQKSPLRALWRFMPKTPTLALALDLDGAVRQFDKDEPTTVTLVRSGDETTAEPVGEPAQPVADGRTDAPVDAEIVPDPPPADEPHSPGDGEATPSGRQPIGMNGTRKALIAAIEEKLEPDQFAAAEIVAGEPIHALDYLTTEELRSVLGMTVESVREYVAGASGGA
jgi:recombination protein RecT